MKITRDYDPMNNDFTVNITAKGLDASFEFDDRMAAETLAFLLESANLKAFFVQQSFLRVNHE